MEALEGNKVKLTVEVEEAEFETDLDAAFKRLAREVRLPGFRPGKAPRKVIEARIGSEYARQDAFREGLPNYYVEAIKEHEVDVIGPPEFDITGGELSGPVVFDAVVEIRPKVAVSGYETLEVTIPSPFVAESEIDEAVDRMRGQFGDLQVVDRPAEDGDRITIDIEVLHEGEPVAGLTADDYLYQVGMGGVVPEMDEQLLGASAGDELSFTADHPDEDEEEPLEFSITVKDVQAAVLPELTDEFVKENSEFETVADLRADYTDKLGRSRMAQAMTARRGSVGQAVAELVSDEDLPAALVDLEVENRAQDLAMRLQAQGLTIDQYMQFTGTSREDMLAELRESATGSAKLDLALRAIAEAEGLTATDEDLDAEFAKVAEQIGRSLDDVRAEFASAGQLSAVRSDLAKGKAMDWLVERTKIVDEDGTTIDPAVLVMPELPEEPTTINEVDDDSVDTAADESSEGPDAGTTDEATTSTEGEEE